MMIIIYIHHRDIVRSTVMATASDPVVIVSAARTPLGKFMGDLAPFSAHKLGSHVIGAVVERANLSPERIDEVSIGCVLPAGQGQAPAVKRSRWSALRTNADV
jgi:acetyl-CoA C-acetyltransferase